MRAFELGDHACAVYSSKAQLVRLVSRFLAEGLTRHEHCWYIGPRLDVRAIRRGLQRRGLNPDREVHIGALRFLLPSDVYVMGDEFDPGRTDRAFGEAITQAQLDGFRGLRVAAEVSWALSIDRGAEGLVAYEAHAHAGFAAAPVTGLCLYHRRRFPLHVLNGALLTHPLTTASRGLAGANPFYDPEATTLSSADDRDVAAKLRSLKILTHRSTRRA
jgi:hypothetical protein